MSFRWKTKEHWLFENAMVLVYFNFLSDSGRYKMGSPFWFQWLKYIHIARGRSPQPIPLCFWNSAIYWTDTVIRLATWPHLHATSFFSGQFWMFLIAFFISGFSPDPIERTNINEIKTKQRPFKLKNCKWTLIFFYWNCLELVGSDDYIYVGRNKCHSCWSIFLFFWLIYFIHFSGDGWAGSVESLGIQFFFLFLLDNQQHPNLAVSHVFIFFSHCCSANSCSVDCISSWITHSTHWYRIDLWDRFRDAELGAVATKNCPINIILHEIHFKTDQRDTDIINWFLIIRSNLQFVHQ